MQYKIGTCTCTNGSAVVTGQNTLWLAEVSAGDSFKAKDDNVIYTLLSVNSNTQVTLTSNYSGTTQSNIEYQIARDFTPNFDLGEISSGDIDWPTHLTINTIRKIDTALANNREKIYEGDSSVEVIDTGSDGRIIFTTDGTEKARITNAGRLGVGTASPEQELHIVGTVFVDEAGTQTTPFHARNLTGNTQFSLEINDTDNTIRMRTNPDGGGWSASDITIDADNGRVGIGTATPTAKFHVKEGAIWSEDTLTQTTAFQGINNTGGTSMAIDINDSDNTVRVRTKPDAGAWSTSDIAIDADTGNVGIGTTAPSAKLDISAMARVTGYGTGPTSGAGVEIFYGTPTTATGYIQSFDRTGVAYTDLQIGNASLNQLVLKANGNVGIGTATPTATLQVENSGAGRVKLYDGGISLNRLNTGDPFLQFEVDGVQVYTLGIDNSDSDKFGIWGESSIPNSPRLIITTDGNVGIGTASPDSKALLDLTSTTKGFLPPRMTTTQRDAITSPPTGLTVFNTTTNKMNVYNGSSWGAVVPATNGVIQIVNTQTGAVATGTTTVPFDDTIPQNAEGDQYLTLSITPKNTNNDLIIDVSVILSTSSSADYLAAALFKDSDAGALASTFSYVTGDHPVQLNFKHKMAAGTTSAIAFKVRAGTSGAGTTTLNGQTGVRKHGGVLSSSITITEISN